MAARASALQAEGDRLDPGILHQHPLTMSIIGKYFEYKYGGIYKYLGKEDKPYEVYVKHIWPFQEKVFIKNAKEWLTFAKPLTDEEVKLRMSEDRGEAQAKAMALRKSKNNGTVVK